MLKIETTSFVVDVVLQKLLLPRDVLWASYISFNDFLSSPVKWI